MRALCDCGQYVIGTSGRMYDFSLCDCGQCVIGTSDSACVVRLRSVRRRDVWPYVLFFVVRLRSVRRRDVWLYVGFSLCDSRRWGISRLFKKFTVRKIGPGNFHRRRESCGNDVAYVLRTSGCLMRPNWGRGNINERWSRMW